jgi:hypothetical protein
MSDNTIAGIVLFVFFVLWPIGLVVAWKLGGRRG